MTRDAQERLLVIRLGAMGDLMHVSPSLSAVRAARPEMEIHLLTAPLYCELGAAIPGVDRVWTFDKRHAWAEMRRLKRELPAISQVVNLHPSFKTGVLSWLLGPRQTVVYRKQKLKPRGVAQRDMVRRHAVEDFYEPFRALFGLPSADLNTLTPVLPVQADRPQGSGLRIALIPGVGGKRGNRAWLVASYRTLLSALQARYPTLTVLLVGGPEDQPLAAQLRTPELAGFVEDHCGRHDILGTARLLAGCDLVIGGDTGPLHLAGAVGVPVLGLFGPTSVARTGPHGLQQGDIQTLAPPESLPCWPCELPTCPLTGEEHLACMQGISVEAVLAACRTLLSGKSAQ